MKHFSPWFFLFHSFLPARPGLDRPTATWFCTTRRAQSGRAIHPGRPVRFFGSKRTATWSCCSPAACPSGALRRAEKVSWPACQFALVDAAGAMVWNTALSRACVAAPAVTEWAPGQELRQGDSIVSASGKYNLTLVRGRRGEKKKKQSNQ